LVVDIVVVAMTVVSVATVAVAFFTLRTKPAVFGLLILDDGRVAERKEVRWCRRTGTPSHQHLDRFRVDGADDV
jgi:hypothetical protein